MEAEDVVVRGDRWRMIRIALLLSMYRVCVGGWYRMVNECLVRAVAGAEFVSRMSVVKVR